MKTFNRSLAAALCCLAGSAIAGDRLLATGGAQQIEGQAGGGVVPWALIAGYGTRDQVGGSAFYTGVHTDDFDLGTYGAAVGFFNRVELSYAKQDFDAGSVIPGLKLKQDIVGAKVRVYGDAVYDQDSPWPQITLGLQYKRNTTMTIPTAIGAKDDSDTDFYVAATKIWLAGFMGRNVLGNLTLRATRANQMGLLGFGGDKSDSRKIEPEVSVAVLLTDNLALGIENRWKPNNLSAFKEDNFGDVFLAWFPTRNIAVTGAYTTLGSIAGKADQKGPYLSVQLTL
jgi:Protein of unknown function (DUF3034)